MESHCRKLLKLVLLFLLVWYFVILSLSTYFFRKYTFFVQCSKYLFVQVQVQVQVPRSQVQVQVQVPDLQVQVQVQVLKIGTRVLLKYKYKYKYYIPSYTATIK